MRLTFQWRFRSLEVTITVTINMKMYFSAAEFLCKIVNAMPVVCITTSIYTMVAMSVERYRRVVLCSIRVLHWRQAFMVTGFVWLLAVAVAMPTAVAFVVKPDSANGTKAVCESKMTATYNLINSQIVLWMCYALPQGAFYANYGRLVAFLWRRSRRQGRVAPATQMSVDAKKDALENVRAVAASFNASDGANFLPESVTKKNWKVVKMLLLLVLLFLVSWCPYFTLQTIAVSFS